VLEKECKVAFLVDVIPGCSHWPAVWVPRISDELRR
jgi:hypothetical protein